MAGAREAHGLISKLLARGRQVIASLPAPERTFDALPVPTRIGAFGDQAALEDWLRSEKVTCIIDASHAFDARIVRQTVHAATRLDLRYLRVLRPEWTPGRQDRWSQFRSLRKAAEAVTRGERVFCNTGRANLDAFEDFQGQRLYIRQNHPTTDAPPFGFARFVSGQPPYPQLQEEVLFRELRITRLICRNVGGSASISKLLAARRLGLRVSMVARPDPPGHTPRVETVTEALAWEADG
ncbi:precorrin-6A/cobalt-precorrin-6A reductase [uncultured Roseobacter sp.]|uniref:precorrin-6A/cobalt-precorrin-6A reductase n=1 Tax=uncultured Roseobacter sp. TaxID=114847 RepID=UPI002634302A|nr:precorrin-6A/cobalt-precorrin-6A reductase [uncultured Roseobacter sp.]